MAELFWETIALPVFVGAGVSFIVECLLQPGTVVFWRRPLAALSIHVGCWLLLFSFELAVFRRPWFAATIVLAFFSLLVLISNAKFYSLREPFIFQDFEYFTDAIKHPRLYLPFLGLRRVFLAIAAFTLAVYAGMSVEPSLTGRVSLSTFLLGVTTLVFFSVVFLWLGARRKLPVRYQPEGDLWQLGLIASLWRYAEEEHVSYFAPSSVYDCTRLDQKRAVLPNLVVVQSESFFDARDLFAGIRPEVLGEFDSIKKSSVCQGKLKVPAWGANTVRAEFAFLAGLAEEGLGVHRFNPYRKLARQGVPTLALFLKNLGYQTVCVHPYSAGFYSRNEVFPRLGFDAFIDIRSFTHAERAGTYVSDVAVAEKICALLETTSSQPIFVFVITMENHGPLHLEKVQEGDFERLYSRPPLTGCEDLTIYLRHLRNADRMAGMLRDRLNALPGAGWLCWFGDHVPIMPKVYGAVGAPDGKTDYLIWQKGGNPEKGDRLDLSIENLGHLLLRKMGLVSAPKKED